MNNINYYRQKTGVMKFKSTIAVPFTESSQVCLQTNTALNIFCLPAQKADKRFPCYSLTQRYDKYCTPLTYPLKVIRKEQEKNKDNKKKNQVLLDPTNQITSQTTNKIKCTSTEYYW